MTKAQKPPRAGAAVHRAASTKVQEPPRAGAAALRAADGVVKIHGSGQILAEPLGLRLTLRLRPGHADRATPESCTVKKSPPTFVQAGPMDPWALMQKALLDALVHQK